MHAGADDAAGRTAGLGGGFDADPPLPEGKDFGPDDTVVGQIENDGESVRALGSRLDQGS
ncbi:hypothetical protein [Arthrobacter sp. MMS18-M83]|uniref:hypothetical protein n=1 Tax=Arthrobacter sp. MMS18-M83 TaxID=2996261 RepID=UPI00227BE0EE|nr:hypothetical protein [Arthrobacter sp. MMS18-M83]WAH99718.1 hypothetical protein OW521_15895 [Arthrobacter sp. MMS18-M83]